MCVLVVFLFELDFESVLLWGVYARNNTLQKPNSRRNHAAVYSAYIASCTRPYLPAGMVDCARPMRIFLART